MVYEISSGCLHYRMKEKCMTREMAASYPSNRNTREARLIKESGIPARTIKSRMRKKGLTVEEAIAFKPEHKYKYGASVNAIAAQHGMPSGTLHGRIGRGMSLEEAIKYKHVRKYKHGFSVEAIAVKHGFVPQTLYSRLDAGLSIKEAITRPLKPSGRKRA